MLSSHASFQVKLIFTRKVIVTLILGMLVYQASLLIPIYLGYEIKLISTTVDNITETTLTLQAVFLQTIIICWLISYSIPTTGCFFVIMFCTVFLVIKLKQNSQIRSAMRAARTHDNTVRETMIARMVVLVSSIYILCLSPSVAIFTTTSFFPRFEIFDSYYGGLVFLCLSLASALLGVSSCMNILVYLKMSAKFRDAFKNMFLC